MPIEPNPEQSGLPPTSSAPAPETRTAALLDRIRALAEVLSAALFAALFLTFVAQVFWRYVLDDPLVWTLEVAGLLFVVVSLFTAATQMPIREHVALDLVVEAFPKPVTKLMRSVSLLVFAVVMLLSVPDTLAVLEWMFGERTFALRLNLGWLFVLMIGFVIIYAARALIETIALWRGEKSTSER
ncbi:MAG: TRAP transporter small permease subunit [Pseudomonadota bacterium]